MAVVSQPGLVCCCVSVATRTEAPQGVGGWVVVVVDYTQNRGVPAIARGCVWPTLVHTGSHWFTLVHAGPH